MSRKSLILLALVGLPLLDAQPGIAQEKPPVHGSWPIENGFNRQPTQSELRALHEQDVPASDARELDRLYDELMSSGTHHTGIARMR